MCRNGSGRPSGPGTASINQPGRVDGPAAAAATRRPCERLAELTCPVLAVAGALDFSEVAATADFLAANAPDARAVVWDDVAHMIGMEQPDRLAGVVLGFVHGLPEWSA